LQDMGTWMPSDGSFESWKKAQGLDEPKESKTIRYFCGVDLGKRHDNSTVCICEQIKGSEGESHYYVRLLKRFPIQSRYTAIAKALAKMDSQLKDHGAKKGKVAEITYILDSTGVGEAVTELVEKNMPYADIVKCYLTGGINTNIDEWSKEVHLPKSQMVSNLVALFDAGQISLTKKSKEIDAMLEELQNYEIRVSSEGRDQYGAFAGGAFDDLVTSLALAVWAGEQDQYQPIEMW